MAALTFYCVAELCGCKLNAGRAGQKGLTWVTWPLHGSVGRVYRRVIIMVMQSFRCGRDPALHTERELWGLTSVSYEQRGSSVGAELSGSSVGAQ